MGRKRRKKNTKCDSDEEMAIVENSKKNIKGKYGLRPRKTQINVEESVIEEENEELSDFENELGDFEDDVSDFEEKLSKKFKSGKAIRTKANNRAIVNENESDLIDYEELIQPGIICNEKYIDYEKLIVKSEIQILPKTTFPKTAENSNRRGRKPKQNQVLENTKADQRVHKVEGEEAGLENPDSPHLVIQSSQKVKVKESVDMTNEENQSPTEKTAMDSEEHESTNVTVTYFSTDDSNNLEQTLNLIEIEDTNTVMESANKYWPGLVKAMDNPQNYFVTCSEQIAVLREKAPKAKYHYLIVPKENIRGLAELSVRHIDMIKNMLEMSKTIARYPEHKNVNFKVGFNAQASMFIYNQKFLWLHLHLISDDMQSDDLVLKKHWNAINSRLFINPEDIIKQLEETGTCKVPPLNECKEILNGDMKCHKCDFTTARFIAMKKHIVKEHIP